LKEKAMTGVGQPRPTGRFELGSWFFMRISGLLLLLLAVGHLFAMHIFSSVEHIDFDFVAERYQTMGWRMYDLALLLLALLHGFNGLRTVLEDYVHAPGWRVFLMALVYTLVFLLGVVGSVVILTFPIQR